MSNFTFDDILLDFYKINIHSNHIKYLFSISIDDIMYYDVDKLYDYINYYFIHYINLYSFNIYNKLNKYESYCKCFMKISKILKEYKKKYLDKDITPTLIYIDTSINVSDIKKYLKEHNLTSINQIKTFEESEQNDQLYSIEMIEYFDFMSSIEYCLMIKILKYSINFIKLFKTDSQILNNNIELIIYELEEFKGKMTFLFEMTEDLSIGYNNIWNKDIKYSYINKNDFIELYKNLKYITVDIDKFIFNSIYHIFSYYNRNLTPYDIFEFFNSDYNISDEYEDSEIAELNEEKYFKIMNLEGNKDIEKKLRNNDCKYIMKKEFKFDKIPLDSIGLIICNDKELKEKLNYI